MIRQVLVDFGLVVAMAVVIGASAPRWPDRWLDHDRFPLARLPWERPAYFRRLRVASLARRLPEMGSAFGGQSKDSLPGSSPEALRGYLVEVRRAEWVHWLSCASPVVLFAFNPWWLALTFLIVVTLANLPFLLVLRRNRMRILQILAREAVTRGGEEAG